MFCNPWALLVVISFHSLEDRIVKQFIASIRASSTTAARPFAAPKPRCAWRRWGASSPSAAEVAANPRARSADHARGAQDSAA
jgi:16S rRNA (cytosine1402-N4)-methyltransferase